MHPLDFAHLLRRSSTRSSYYLPRLPHYPRFVRAARMLRDVLTRFQGGLGNVPPDCEQRTALLGQTNREIAQAFV